MYTRKLFAPILILLVFGLSFSSCGSDAEDDLQFIVYPGDRVNDLEIGDLGSEIVDVLGSSNTVLRNSLNDGTSLFTVTNTTHKIQFFMGSGLNDANFESLTIKNIKFYGSFTGMTQEGISIGSTLSEVESTYGTADVDAWGTHSYDNIGIFFNYDDNDLVEDFSIYD